MQVIIINAVFAFDRISIRRIRASFLCSCSSRERQSIISSYTERMAWIYLYEDSGNVPFYILAPMSLLNTCIIYNSKTLRQEPEKNVIK